MAGQLGMQFGRSAVLAGNDYVQKNFDRFIPVSSLKYYFAVSNTYVIYKLAILLFPFRHKPWSRMARRSEENGQMEGYKLPREDINAPDMYIPVMAFVTYVLLVGIVVGREDKFDPSILGLTATTAIGLVALEVGLLKLGCYLLNITTDIQFLDLVAYCGYKFVGVIFTVLIQFIFPGRGMWIAFAYTCMAIGFFLLRSLRYIVLPDSSNTPSTVLNPQRKRRVHFLFAMATLQLVSMWFLSITVNPIETVPTKPIGGTAPTST
ncbi:hypothetical protein BDF19DRAFT_387730 [Syncephalis fuscata]|nr:hypothetical protein BDF19DRAFT_387730 [Syncephalis fuscata]